MYQIIFKGCFETENPDEFVEAIKKLAEEQKVYIAGQFQVFQLPPYVDYQEAEITDSKS